MTEKNTLSDGVIKALTIRLTLEDVKNDETKHSTLDVHCHHFHVGDIGASGLLSVTVYRVIAERLTMVAIYNNVSTFEMPDEEPA